MGFVINIFFCKFKIVDKINIILYDMANYMVFRNNKMSYVR